MDAGNLVAVRTSVEPSQASLSMRSLSISEELKYIGSEHEDPVAARLAERAVKRNEAEAPTLVGELLPLPQTSHRKRRLFSANAPQLDSVVQHIWEGTVTAVDEEQGSMQVVLRSRRVAMDDHSGEIDLAEVMPQDRELVRPGAVFYLTMCRNRLPKGTFQNAQELRFRRTYTWNATQLDRVQQLAHELGQKVRVKPPVE